MITAIGFALSVVYSIGVGYGLAWGLAILFLAALFRVDVSDKRAGQWIVRCLIWPVRLPFMILHVYREFKK